MSFRAALAVVLGVTVALLAGGGSPSFARADQSVVLGAPLGEKDTPRYHCLLRPGDCGWGTEAPRYLTLGGDPSGTITHIHWDRWGGAVATAHGLNWIFAPGGGYYPRPVVIRLRAYDIGLCPPLQTTAYRQMVAREPKRPGGPLGRWQGFSTSGSTWICGWR